MITPLGSGDLQEAAKRVASGLVHARTNGMRTAATSTTGAGRTAAAASSSSTTSTSNEGDITSNDFLTLLVTEMKNQDPTTPTDPNAYITQLVGVNSLQELISINSELGSSSTASSGSASPSAVASSPNSLAAISAGLTPGTQPLYGSQLQTS